MSINNRRARCAVRVASWILRTFAPDYSRVLNNMWQPRDGARPPGGRGIMSAEAIVPCFTCGTTLKNVSEELDNQPYEGTEFITCGHYGSTFWDSFDGEELVINICDDCLRRNTERIAIRKSSESPGEALQWNIAMRPYREGGES
ncbi:hypothetical protein SEA_REINDEER_127 [Mycobacterium phage Reindeer]|uniref:Uncharacterized protein n=1 Tax=Mycobacterium phage Reindeer TaxID=2762283 RepID=A0A7G8LI46_9CAUD|nr:hypothetical protein J4U05_gp125 [Mycobacterium phage Reindeer]QNJ56918.1 hypothetical protein SEA_REINDEER_127 [Mycobacterium phage Reindeer]